MATTIDTIQVEIQSSSANAARGIQELSTALAGLKTNGKITTAVNNLNNLRKALHSFGNIPSNASKVLSLASSLEKLKSVGSVATVGNSLTKLASSLKTLNTVSVDKGKIDRIADSLSSLSNVKAGGINTMMNGLLKISKVTKELNDDAINAFADRVEKLTAKLTPLSEKMTSVQAGLRAINSSARSAGNGVREMGEDVDAASVNFASFIYVVQEAVQWIQAAIQKFSEFMSEAVEWDGIAARFGRGFGSRAQETYAWIQRLNEEMGINVQQFMQYSSVYATMLTGFGVANEDAATMALAYTELTYDIWAGYNDIYKNFADAAEAVKSAIAGEVEPIRRAGFTIVEATLEQTAANHGLSISLHNATEAQKSYLRYLTLIDQAKAQGLVGTYAKELHTAEGLTRTLAQQMKSLTQAFGSLFLPILVRVVPWIQAFVELLTDAIKTLAAFLGITLQDVDWSSYSAGIGGAAENTDKLGQTAADTTKAIKELKNATLGIDELNVISPPSASGSAGAGGAGAGGSGVGGLDIGSLWDETIFDSIQSDVDAIKEKLKGWLPVIGAVAAGFAALRLVQLVADIKEAYEELSKLLGITKIFGGGGVLAGLLANAKMYFAAVIQMIPEVGLFAALFPKLSVWIAEVGTVISGLIGKLGAFGTAIGGAVKAVAAFLGLSVGATIAVIVAVVAALASAVYFVWQNWDGVTQAVKNFFTNNIQPKLEQIASSFGELWQALVSVWDALVNVGVSLWNLIPPQMQFVISTIAFLIGTLVEALWDWFVSIDWLKAFGTVIEWLGGLVVAVLGGVIAGAINGLVGIIMGAVEVITGVVQIVSGVVSGLINLIVGVFTGDLSKAYDSVKLIGEGIVNVFKGLLDIIFAVVGDLVWGVIDWFKEMWDVLVGHSIVPDTINAIVKWFTSLPGKVFTSVQNFVTGIIDKFKNLGSGLTQKFSSAWSAVKSWWGKKTSLSAYTPSIGSIYEKLKDRWESARTWWNGKKTKLSEYTPSIGSIYEKLSVRWKNARDWWNQKKGSMSYTPSIGSITDKLKSAWNSAKTWWNKNVKLSTKLDIKVPKIEVKWDTASAFGKSFRYPTGFKLNFAADGGIFDQGSLVWAGERGPEIVANASGGKTGVMNVQQMQDAVYEGVYSAVVAAMRTTGGDGGNRPVQVVLPDGRVLASSVEKAQRERGASIMGNQVYSYG